MNDRVLKLLRDAIDHGETARAFSADYTFAQYREYAMLRSAVERELSIVGEALQQARRLDPTLEEAIPELAEVVGIRNRLVHGYHQTDDRVVFDAVRDPLTVLIAKLRALVEG